MSGAASELGLSGRLRESNYRGFLPSRSPDTSTLRKRIFKLRYVQFHVVTKVLGIFSVG